MSSVNISSSNSGWLTGLSGQQLTLAQPGLLGGFLGRVGRGDLRVDLAGVGSPVADSGVHQAQRCPSVTADQVDQVIAVQPGLGRVSRLDGADDFPDVRASG